MTPQRFASQLLSGPPGTSVEAVVERLLAVQAQDGRGARLAVRARSSGLTAGDVDQALADRSVVVGWLNRGTLHLVLARDYWWLHALTTTPPLRTANARRLEQEGVSRRDAERGIELIAATLAERGTATRGELRERLDGNGVRTEGQALVHLLFSASLQGLVVRGPMVGREQSFVLAEDWLGPRPELDRDTALTELARRYLAGHGPADARDLGKWTGLPLRDTQRALAALGDEAATVDGLADLHRPHVHTELPPPRLLGSFDPLLLGWRSRATVVPEHATRLLTDNGWFRPFALVDGTAVGAWRFVSGRVVLSAWGRLSARTARALEGEAADVARYLGLRGPTGFSIE